MVEISKGSTDLEALTIGMDLVRLVADLTIASCHWIVAGMLFRSRGKRAIWCWTFGLMAVGASLSTLREADALLFALRAGLRSAMPLPLEFPVWKVTAAGFWVATVSWLPAIFREFRAVFADHGPPGPARPSLQSKMVKMLIHHESRLLKKVKTHRELVSAIDDVEMMKCKI